MSNVKISKRLEAAASFVRRGVRVADIGTDHAYLPIYLYNLGLIAGGVASDVNEGPAARAASNVSDYGVSHAIAVKRADGLHGIAEYEPDDIFILGMGGELIASMISEADWVKDSRYRLILQPMTHAEVLRKYLYESGFSIIDELMVKDDRLYQIICAEYGDRDSDKEMCESADVLELLLGRYNIERGGELLQEALLRLIQVYSERLRGKLSAGVDASYEQKVIEKATKKLTELDGGFSYECT